MEFIKEQLIASYDQNFGHLGNTVHIDMKKIFKMLRENDFEFQKLKNGKYHCKVRLPEKSLNLSSEAKTPKYSFNILLNFLTPYSN